MSATDVAEEALPELDLSGKRIWVAGHRGMVGSAVVRRLRSEGCEIVTVDRSMVDLRDQSGVLDWIDRTRPDVVVLAAAKVGGILANDTYPGQFLHDNLAIQTNVIEAARRSRVSKLLFLGSSCIYPKFAPQPIREDSLLTGPLEPTNEWYAIAKIAGLKLVEAYRREYGCDFISAMPTNLYGPGDNYDLRTGHVMAALIRKAHEAKESRQESIVIWGTGTPRREFIYVDDCADALVLLLKRYSAPSHVNVGFGSDVTILDLARTICDIVGFDGDLVLDQTKPDGTPRKLLDSSLLRSLGWAPSVDLREGITKAYRAFLETEEAGA